MSLFITIFKTIWSFFPFLAELFLLDPEKIKDPSKRKIPIPEKFLPMIRRVVLMIGIVALAATVFLSKRSWEMSKEIEKYRELAKVVNSEIPIHNAPPAASSADTTAVYSENEKTTPDEKRSNNDSEPKKQPHHVRRKNQKTDLVRDKGIHDDVLNSLKNIQQTYHH